MGAVAMSGMLLVSVGGRRSCVVTSNASTVKAEALRPRIQGALFAKELVVVDAVVSRLPGWP